MTFDDKELFWNEYCKNFMMKRVNIVITATPTQQKAKIKGVHPIVVAAATFTMDEDYIVLHTFAVLDNELAQSRGNDRIGGKKDWRGLGIGRFVVQFGYLYHCCLMPNDIVPLLVQTNTTNQPAMNFYKRLRFDEVVTQNAAKTVFHELNWKDKAKNKVVTGWNSLRLTDCQKKGSESLRTFTLLPHSVQMLPSRVRITTSAPTKNNPDKQDDDTVTEPSTGKPPTPDKNSGGDTSSSGQNPGVEVPEVPCASTENSKANAPPSTGKKANEDLPKDPPPGSSTGKTAAKDLRKDPPPGSNKEDAGTPTNLGDLPTSVAFKPPPLPGQRDDDDDKKLPAKSLPTSGNTAKKKKKAGAPLSMTLRNEPADIAIPLERMQDVVIADSPKRAYGSVVKLALQSASTSIADKEAIQAWLRASEEWNNAQSNWTESRARYFLGPPTMDGAKQLQELHKQVEALKQRRESKRKAFSQALGRVSK